MVDTMLRGLVGMFLQREAHKVEVAGINNSLEMRGMVSVGADQQRKVHRPRSMLRVVVVVGTITATKHKVPRVLRRTNMPRANRTREVEC